MQNQLFVNHSLLNRRILRPAAAFFLAAMLAALAGCGSGGAGGSPASATAATGTTGTTGTTVTVTPTASIQLLASTTQIASSGASTVDLTAIVLSATKQVIQGKTVTFSTGTDTSAFVNNVSGSGISDANGLVTAQLNLGGDKANRSITISATADTVTATNSVDVTGTTLAISGNNSLALGASTTLTFSVKDSAGNALANKTVAVASTTGNTIVLNPTTGITNSSGQITATVTASKAGNDTITATAAGASATQALTVSSASFTFTAPAALTEIPLGTASTVTVSWSDAVTSPAGKTVSFSTSRGTIAGGTVTASSSTLAGGSASVTVSSTTAGPAIITASGPGGTPAATLDVIFVATSASSATVQAIPGTVQVTTGSATQSNNSSNITVVVRDAANNLVKNANVSFTITADPTGGKLTSSSGITDVTGSASVTYVAGATSSAQNGVTVSATATIGATTAVGTASLTVSGQSLLVRLGTDNKVGGTTPLNTKTYVAIVTDAAGNPVVGTTVQFALRPSRYRKGTFVPDPTNTFWVQSVSATCPNEDLNFNGILDPGEGLVAWPAGQTPSLLPGAVASVNASAVTDASGIATATITYAKSYSLWVEETLEARTAVTTNDPPSQATFFLPGLADDYISINIQPPGRPSPFGVNASCADTL